MEHAEIRSPRRFLQKEQKKGKKTENSENSERGPPKNTKYVCFFPVFGGWRRIEERTRKKKKTLPKLSGNYVGGTSLEQRLPPPLKGAQLMKDWHDDLPPPNTVVCAEAWSPSKFLVTFWTAVQLSPCNQTLELFFRGSLPPSTRPSLVGLPSD